MNSEVLICKFKDCGLIYENPVSLSCGNSLCKQHLDDEIFDDDKFVCYFCDEQHQMPLNGLAINKVMIQMINNHFHLDPLRKEIKESFDKLSKLIEENYVINLMSNVFIVLDA